MNLSDAAGETPSQRSAGLVRRAEELIARLRVRELWGRIGRPVLVGSARYGLMTSPNIDFEIYAERPEPAAGAAVVAELAADPRARVIRHLDFMGSAEDPGLYWNLEYHAADDTVWDFDFWFVPLSHPHAGMAEAFAAAMLRTLTPETRLAVLSLKAQLANRGEKRPRGIDIARAVLEGGVRDVRGFDLWRAENPPRELETWRPGECAPAAKNSPI